MDWTAIWLTLRLAACTSVILCLLGLPVAYWLATSTWRWRFLLEATVALPLILPPTVLGFYLLMAMGPHSPLGRAYTSVVGRTLPFSFPGLLIASVIYSLPRHPTFVLGRNPYGHRPVVRPHAGRIRRRADGRGQHSQ